MLHLRLVPTTRPRYTITDTGDMAAMLDVAHQRWPEVQDRKELLVRLAAAGRDAIADAVDAGQREQRLERQRAALSRAGRLLDADVLLADTAWH